MASRGATVRDELATCLATELDGLVDRVEKCWLPVVEPADVPAGQKLLTVRSVGRSSTQTGKDLSNRDVIIELALIGRGDEAATRGQSVYVGQPSVDRFDPIDDLAEQIFDRFTPPGEDNAAHVGSLFRTSIAGHIVHDVEQPAAVIDELLRTKNLFLTVIAVTYRKRD